MRKTDKNAAPDATRKAASKTDVLNITQHGYEVRYFSGLCLGRHHRGVPHPPRFFARASHDLGTVQQVCMIAKALEQRAALEG